MPRTVGDLHCQGFHYIICQEHIIFIFFFDVFIKQIFTEYELWAGYYT